MKSKIFQEILDETPEDIKIFVRLYSELVIKINHILKEKNYTQAKLAEKLGKSPSEIHKWLSGEHNFTLRSIAKLSAELETPLLEVSKSATVEKFPDFTKRTYVLTSYSEKKKSKCKVPQNDWLSTTKRTLYANVG
jgi:transcriptional regulator with XRE-family HTH domain